MKKIIMKKNTCQSGQFVKKLMFIVPLIGFLLLPFKSVFGQPVINLCVGQTQNLASCAGDDSAYLSNNNPAISFTSGTVANNGGNPLTITGNFPATGISLTCFDGPDAIVTFTVNVNPLPIASVVTTAACNGADDGTATVSGGNSYSWSDGLGTSATQTGLAAGTYTVTAFDANLCASAPLTVIITESSPTITTQPMSVDACFGDDVTFSAAASGGTAPFTYQWQRDCPGSFTDIAGETSASLTLTGIQSFNRCDYRVIITDAAGCELISDAATLDAASPTSVTTQPMPATACGGEDAEFTIVMRSTTVDYQWQSDCSGTFTDIAGATSATYTISAPQASDACNYQVVVTNASDCITTSNPVSLTVGEPLTIDTQPMSVDVCYGDDVTFSAAASGGTAPLTYQWQKDCSGSFTDIAGETSASLSITVSSSDRCDYRVVITDAGGCTVTSDAATLDAASPPIVTTQPTPANACLGDDAEFTIVINDTNVTYQWQSNCSGAFTDIAGATSATYTLSNAQTTDVCDYQVVVTNANGCITTSNTTVLAIIPTEPPTATTTDFTICEGDAIPDFEADEITADLAPNTYQIDDGGVERQFGSGTATWGNMFPINSADCDNGCSVVSFDVGFGRDFSNNLFSIVGTTANWIIYTDDDGDPTAGLSAPLATGTHTIVNEDFAVNGMTDNISVANLDFCSTLTTNPFLFISLSYTNSMGSVNIATIDDNSPSNQSWIIFNVADGTQAGWTGGATVSGNFIIRANFACETTCDINWFDAPAAGNMVATNTTTFNSNGITGEEGTTVDTNTPGTYTFYAETDCQDCPSGSRTPFILTVQSAELQCIAQDITITLDGTGNATITTADIDNGSMLGCGSVGTLNLSLDQTTFTCDDVSTTNTVTLTADDGNGNMSTCMATVTVLPDASCTKFDCPPTQISCTGEPFNCNPAEPGGTYGGTAAPFVMNDILNPTGMPPGSYTLTYTINGITSEVCEFIVVRPTKTANAGSLRN